MVLNVGSSSVKFQLIRTNEERLASDTDERLARGIVERIGGEAVYSYRANVGAPVRGTAALRDHRAALDHILRWLTSA
jgi:acetate kinase